MGKDDFGSYEWHMEQARKGGNMLGWVLLIAFPLWLVWKLVGKVVPGAVRDASTWSRLIGGSASAALAWTVASLVLTMVVGTSGGTESTFVVVLLVLLILSGVVMFWVALIRKARSK